MTKIANFICVNGVNNSENGEVMLRSPITTLFLEAIPNNYSFSVFFSIVDLSWNISEKHQLELIVIDPKGKYIFNSGKVTIPLDSPFDEKLKDLSANFSMSNVRFGLGGLHEVKIQIDDNLKSSTFFVVDKKE